MKMCPFTDL